MTFRRDDFHSAITAGEGFARARLFRVELPRLLVGEKNYTPANAPASQLNLLCKNISLPGRQLTTTDRLIGIESTKVGHGYAVEDVTCVFYLLNDLSSRNYFETWQNLVVDQKTKEIGYYNDYAKSVYIKLLKKGVGLPIYNKQLAALEKIPSNIRNRLPSIGPINVKQGEIDLDFITPDTVVYSVELEQAYPTTLSAVELTNEGESLIEVSVSFTYKNWNSTVESTKTNLAETLLNSAKKTLGI